MSRSMRQATMMGNVVANALAAAVTAANAFLMMASPGMMFMVQKCGCQTCPAGTGSLV